ncbi:TonB-dependent receptor [uncultured Sphingomonas sp.]|uniref:TonB-dependent receptor n=1 Tax=uncultured Sphingomonas sp. TaxID=158754 RepID=UPI0035CC7CC9
MRNTMMALSSAIAIGSVAPSVVHAQATTPQASAVAPDTPSAQSDIVVTAQRRPQALTDVPMSITTLSGNQLVDRGVTDVQSLVKVTPGLSYAESGNGVPVFSLRGVGFFDTTLGARPSVSVYEDEVPLPFTIMAQGAALDLERVEVLKGPQGTLFGQNATGGAINYIAARPTDKFGGGADVSFARFNTFDATGYVSGPLTETLGVRLSGRVERGGDWQYSYTRNDTLGAKRFYQGRILFDFKPSDTTSFVLNVNGFVDQSDTQAAQRTGVVISTAASALVPIVVNYPAPPSNDRAADWNPGLDLRRNNKFFQASLRAEQQLGSILTLTSLTSYSNMNVDQLVDQGGVNVPASITRVTGTLSSFAQELRLSGDAGPVKFVVGGNYSHDISSEFDTYNSAYASASIALGSNLNDLDGGQRFNTKAVFGNVDLDLGRQFVLHGGARYTSTKDQYNSCVLPANASSAAAASAIDSSLRRAFGFPAVTYQIGSCATLIDDRTSPNYLQPLGSNGTLNENNVSWRAGLDWKPAPSVLIYANISRGYKAGSSPVLAAFLTSQLQPVTQESVLAYEAGFKVPIVRRVLEVTGAGFYYNYTNKQVLGRILGLIGPAQALVNVPKSRVAGAELQLNAYPVRGMTLVLAGTYLDTRVTSDFTNYDVIGNLSDFKGNSFPFTPKYQLVADWQYDIPVTARLTGLLGVNANYRSSTNSGFGNDPRLAINAYTLVDARIGLKASDRRWQAALFVRNLTDKYYWTSEVRLADILRRYTGEPRTYGIQVSTSF